MAPWSAWKVAWSQDIMAHLYRPAVTTAARCATNSHHGETEKTKENAYLGGAGASYRPVVVGSTPTQPTTKTARISVLRSQLRLRTQVQKQGGIRRSRLVDLVAAAGGPGPERTPAAGLKLLSYSHVCQATHPGWSGGRSGWGGTWRAADMTRQVP